MLLDVAARLCHSDVCGAVHNVGTNIRKATVEYTDNDYQLIMSANLESTYKLSQVLSVLLLPNNEMASLHVWCPCATPSER